MASTPGRSRRRRQTPRHRPSSALNPARGATGVLADSDVTATFSEAIQPGTISFVLRNGSTTVPSTVAYDPTTRTVTLDPSSNLASSTTYTATLSGAQDLSGNAMTTSTWSFTTAAAPSSPFVSRGPVANAILVPVGNAVTATFNTAMNPDDQLDQFHAQERVDQRLGHRQLQFRHSHGDADPDVEPGGRHHLHGDAERGPGFVEQPDDNGVVDIHDRRDGRRDGPDRLGADPRQQRHRRAGRRQT